MPRPRSRPSPGSLPATCIRRPSPPAPGRSATVSRAATVYDVADRAGVSIATVSRVLRSPDAVRPVTRERVLDAVTALGYVPSGSARGLAERRTGVLGLYFPGFDAAEDAPPLDALSAARADAPPFAVVRRRRRPRRSAPRCSSSTRCCAVRSWRRGSRGSCSWSVSGATTPTVPPCATWPVVSTASWSSRPAFRMTCWRGWRGGSPSWSSLAPRAGITTTT
ncbi:LacI family DNA-binding transcriptional regulator [Microbacterium sp. Se63.02b]|uniref:LacI family DNA-binding transcriptional regulator n=1 Tax=Microbacterium sp. Se63.02b TaxID=2709304 RepID=UPI001FCE3F5F|nr:LacI family DNA-binding transcriptional regulator [Microbacterium sp. Se63.02b]